MESILLQFPPDFDPFNATPEQTVQLVKLLWTVAKLVTAMEAAAREVWADRDEARFRADQPDLFASPELTPEHLRLNAPPDPIESMIRSPF
ncbi:MAG TPA: hypothetical protein VKE40_23285 [Gemmataceae bacterium]|nr:hypothetical protein [Gemmataceae bacterium]